MMWWDHGWGWGDWLSMSLMMLLFWGLVIAIIVSVRSWSAQQDAPPAPRRPEDVLAERFVRGEIDETEYQDRLRVLRGGPAGSPTRADITGAPR